MANITTTSIDPQTGKTLYTTRAEDSAIPFDKLQPQKKLGLPEQPTDNTNYQGMINNGNATIGATAPKIEEQDIFSKYMSNLEAPASVGSMYNDLYGQAGISGIQQDIASKQQAQTQAQKELDLLNAQLQGITAESTQAQLQLEAPTGQAKDVTQRFLGRQQQEISRQAAIRALPVQTQVLAAQAKVAASQGDVATAQNNLKLAQDRLNTAFNIQSKDVENLYNYNKSVRDRVYEYATAQEKNKLEAKQKEEDRKFNLLKETISGANNLAKLAIENGQGDIAAKIISLNPSSATYQDDLVKASSGIKSKEKILSPTEAKLLGVPYGTTESQAQAMGITPKEAGDVFTKQEVLKMETDLRKEYNGLQSVKDFSGIKNANSQINSAYQEAIKAGQDNKSKAAADQVLIVAFNKMLDPSSVVREGEYARTTQGQSLMAQLQGKAQAALSGGTGLTDGDRNQIVSMTRRLYNDYLKMNDEKVAEYRSYVKEFGGNPDKIAPMSVKEMVEQTGTDELNFQKMLNDSDFETVKQFLTEQMGNISGGGGTPTASSDAKSIVNAIKQTESSGNYNVKGASGETGAYQFMPNTWANYKKQYEQATGEILSGQTPENQDKVAEWKVQQWLDNGYDVKQIASMWNAGEGRPDAWKNWKGVNALGVAYDTPAYVKKVLKNLG